MSTDERLTILEGTGSEGALWTPVPGASIEELARTLEEEGEIDQVAFSAVTDAAIQVLSQAVPPTDVSGRRTGLVVGYVQSGKTMSMTTVAALARDNGFRMVIVFAGVTKILLSQTRDRFESHLQPAGQYLQQWTMFDSEKPRLLRRLTHELQNLLVNWRNANIPETRKPALLITVMKQRHHLAALTALLTSADLSGIPVLVIDDEADQAGLNTAPGAARASSTHRHIAAVRTQLPHHTYLQYTATPQAPLLISLVDMLSPDFAEVLEAGEGYAGGQAFFGGRAGLVQRIAADELFRPGDPPTAPPDGLLRALQLFFVAIAACAIERRRGQWSMLIHPSQRQADHNVYYRWVQAIQTQWRDDLQLPELDPDRQALIEEFRAAYADLSRTDGNLPPFDEVAEEITYRVGTTVVTELNSDSGSEVRWSNGFAHILVGGEKLNRGFTIRGLMCTYMPRSAGGWNADTIQQRARFFGYKASYVNRCRVHLHPDVLIAYRDYVEHETHVRAQLAEFRGRPLAEWKRAFFMDGALRPTRNNILRDPFYRVRQRQDWFIQRRPHDPAIREHNTALLNALLTDYQFEQYWDDGRHLSAVLPLSELQEHLLVPLAVLGTTDVPWMYAVRVWIEELIARGVGGQARLIVMDGGRNNPSARIRRRGAENGLIKELPQGRDNDGLGNYPGDRRMFDPDRVTIQVHRLRVSEGASLVEDVFAIAVRIPTTLSNVIVQPGQA